MKEKEFLSVIKTIIGDDYIGDDCANLKDLGIVVTQDSLVEGVHFSLDYANPWQLGYKSVMVNLSDIASSGAEGRYITISLSLPTNTSSDFIEKFYNGVKSACGNGIKVVGGDITGSDRVYVSICAIGVSNGRNISSRSDAKVGYKIVVSGVHGSSGFGLKLLNGEINCDDDIAKRLIKAHLEPTAQIEFGLGVSEKVRENYAMMDTSDGLMDALITIANESGVLLEVDYDRILYDKAIEQFENWEDLVLFGGEDYGIVAVIPQKYDIGGVTIGQVKAGCGVDLIKKGKKIHFSRTDVENKVFNHFK